MPASTPPRLALPQPRVRRSPSTSTGITAIGRHRRIRLPTPRWLAQITNSVKETRRSHPRFNFSAQAGRLPLGRDHGPLQCRGPRPGLAPARPSPISAMCRDDGPGLQLRRHPDPGVARLAIRLKRGDDHADMPNFYGAQGHDPSAAGDERETIISAPPRDPQETTIRGMRTSTCADHRCGSSAHTPHQVDGEWLHESCAETGARSSDSSDGADQRPSEWPYLCTQPLTESPAPASGRSQFTVTGQARNVRACLNALSHRKSEQSIRRAFTIRPSQSRPRSTLDSIDGRKWVQFRMSMPQAA